MVVHRTTASVFLVVRRGFWLSRAHGQPKFRTLVLMIVHDSDNTIVNPYTYPTF